MKKSVLIYFIILFSLEALKKNRFIRETNYLPLEYFRSFKNYNKLLTQKFNKKFDIKPSKANLAIISKYKKKSYTLINYYKSPGWFDRKYRYYIFIGETEKFDSIFRMNFKQKKIERIYHKVKRIEFEMNRKNKSFIFRQINGLKPEITYSLYDFDLNNLQAKAIFSNQNGFITDLYSISDDIIQFKVTKFHYESQYLLWFLTSWMKRHGESKRKWVHDAKYIIKYSYKLNKITSKELFKIKD